MALWPKDAKEFTVSITHNRQRGTSYSYIPNRSWRGWAIQLA